MRNAKSERKCASTLHQTIAEIRHILQRGTVFALDGEAHVITDIHDDGSIHFAGLDADGFAARSMRTITSWALAEAVQTGKIQFIDGARAVLHVTLPPAWASLQAARSVAIRAAESAKIERGDAPHCACTPTHHPAFGMVRLSRAHGGHGRLFGSPFNHHTRITLDIYRATEQRTLSNTRHVLDDVPLLSIAFSEAQFAALICSVAVGEGVPCTLDYVWGQRMPPPPPSHEIAEFKADVQRTMEQAGAGVAEAAAKVEEAVLAGAAKPTKALLREVADRISQVRRAFDDAIPFTVERFNEHMAGIVHAGRLEIEAYIAQRRAFGALLQSEVPLALPGAPPVCHRASLLDWAKPVCGGALTRGDTVAGIHNPDPVTCPACLTKMGEKAP